MSTDTHHKISATHLSRQAYLYVRQSTLRQVLENTESTKRQYGLRERAVAMGWTSEQVVVIDSDLGQSGAGEGPGQPIVDQPIFSFNLMRRVLQKIEKCQAGWQLTLKGLLIHKCVVRTRLG